MFLRGLALRGKARSRILSLHGRADGRRNLFYLIRNPNAHTSHFLFFYLIISFSSCFSFPSQTFSESNLSAVVQYAQAAFFLLNISLYPFQYDNHINDSAKIPYQGRRTRRRCSWLLWWSSKSTLICTCKSNPRSANQESMQHHQL